MAIKKGGKKHWWSTPREETPIAGLSLLSGSTGAMETHTSSIK
jgi:hypothetical protein